jgi:NAD(P)-dependent dehydrogenase (short-subunit alcohol dehydrogenase family)
VSTNDTRTALISGAASGIGAATARLLAAEGVRRFVLVDRDAEALAGIARELPGEVVTRGHDVADEAAWAETEAEILARFGGLDLAVVNAGVAGAAPIAELSFAEWRRILSVNLDGAFLTLRAAMRAMREGGAVVVVASAAAVKAEPGIAAYGASKAGAVQLARVAAKEAAGRRIRVNAIAPGGVETPIWRGMAFFDALVAEKGGE